MINNKQLLLEKTAKYSYGCVMLDLDFPQIKSLHKQIKKEDLYEEKDTDKYGLEKESHITLLYGLHEEVTLDQVKEITDSFSFGEIELTKVDVFDDEKFDILIFKADSKELSKVNKALKKLPFTSEFDDYKPHCTIAYVKKGKGKEYVKLFKDETYEVEPIKIVYSMPSGKKPTIKIKELMNEVKEKALIKLLEKYSRKKVVLEDFKFVPRRIEQRVSQKTERLILLAKKYIDGLPIPTTKRNLTLKDLRKDKVTKKDEEFVYTPENASVNLSSVTFKKSLLISKIFEITWEKLFIYYVFRPKNRFEKKDTYGKGVLIIGHDKNNHEFIYEVRTTVAVGAGQCYLYIDGKQTRTSDWL